MRDVRVKYEDERIQKRMRRMKEIISHFSRLLLWHWYEGGRRNVTAKEEK